MCYICTAEKKTFYNNKSKKYVENNPVYIR